MKAPTHLLNNFARYYSDPRIGQDRWIIEEVFRGKRGGFFIDIGASEGIGASNTYALEKLYGWNGICIEAQDRFYAELCQNRGCVCEHACVDNQNSIVNFRNSLWYGGPQKYLADQVPAKRKWWNRGNVVSKQTTTIDEILHKHKAPKIIDYCSLDIEGGELAVLSSFPFDQYTVLAITVESNQPSRIRTVLHDRGFREVRNNFSCVDEDLHFIHHSLSTTDRSSNKTPVSYGAYATLKLASIPRIMRSYSRILF